MFMSEVVSFECVFKLYKSGSEEFEEAAERYLKTKQRVFKVVDIKKEWYDDWLKMVLFVLFLAFEKNPDRFGKYVKAWCMTLGKDEFQLRCEVEEWLKMI